MLIHHARRATVAQAALGAVMLGLAAVHHSARADAATQALAQGREKYVQCAACHGADGRQSVMPQYPKIGGQTAEYLIIALKAYRDGRRQGSYAAIMTEVAKQLSDADIANLAAYVESLDAFAAAVSQ